jgi:hypothetical protein
MPFDEARARATDPPEQGELYRMYREIKRLRGRITEMVGAFLLLWIAGSVVFALLVQHTDQNTHAIHAADAAAAAHQQAQLNSGCHRLNQVRVVDNDNALADYRFYLSSIAFLAGVLPKDTQPTAVFTRYEEGLQGYASAKTWLPLVNCVLVRSPDYPVGNPVPFSIELPPYDATHLGADN